VFSPTDEVYVSVFIFWGIHRSTNDVEITVGFTGDPKIWSEGATCGKQYKPKVITNVLWFVFPSTHLQMMERAH